jgi:hypothetical protein
MILPMSVSPQDVLIGGFIAVCFRMCGAFAGFQAPATTTKAGRSRRSFSK